MTYHVICPFSNKVYSYETVVAIRRFVYAMMFTMDCHQKVRIKDGRIMMGSMWKIGNTVYYRSKNVRTVRIINQDGTIRRK